jgi:hypothetical protein
MASRRKNVVIYYCKQCKSEREMRSDGKGLDGKIVWLKCTDCGKRTFLTVENWESLVEENSETLVDSVVEYDPNDSFSIGQALYHKIWDDSGEVVKKETTNSGHNMIVVSFARLGERRLVENLGN